MKTGTSLTIETAGGRAEFVPESIQRGFSVRSVRLLLKETGDKIEFIEDENCRGVADFLLNGVTL